jgi:hypothetical protein
VISNDTSLDASGHDLTLSQGRVVQFFQLIQINPGVTLTLNHLSLANGYVRGTNSTVPNGMGGDAVGGAVWNNAGTLQATDCVFTNNSVLGGTGGPATSALAFNSGGGGYGGAIYSFHGALYLTNVLFVGNTAQGGQGGTAPSPAPSEGGFGGASCGGAIYSLTGQVCIASCRFISNSAPASVPGPSNGYNPSSGSAQGGAVWCVSGTNLITDSSFTCQSVGGGHWFCDASAGALYQTAGSLWISGCTFATNRVTGGDGIIIGSGSDAGSADGGALVLNSLATGQQGQSRLYCNAGVSNSCFVANVAKGGLQGPAVGDAGPAYGGAVENFATLNMLNCTLAANTASGGDITYPSYPVSFAYGGGLYNSSGTSILTHVTIALTGATPGAGAGSSYPALGGGIYVSSGKVYVRNSIISSNTAGLNCYGTLMDDGGNLSSDSSCGFSAPGSLNSTDPRLRPLGDYGGPTLTLALGPGSPGRDAANPAFCLPTDQRGVPRPQGAGCDMGAVEAAVLSVQKLTNGSWRLYQATLPSAACTLQGATNLTDWSQLQTTNGDALGHVEFIVPGEGLPALYFRTFGLP